MNTTVAGLIDAEDPARRALAPSELAVWATWMIALVVLARSHEMWRDELQSWAIARDATWPWDLIANTTFEGHPPGWHLLLWCAAQVSDAPGTAHIVSVACAAAAGWLIVRYFPFTLTVRALLLFGYFPLFEIGVISRSYSLLFLLVIAALVLAERRPLPLVPLVLVLAAISWTLVLAIPLAGAIAVSTAIRHKEVERRRLLNAGAVLSALALLAVKVARPPWSRGAGNRSGLVAIEDANSALTGPLRVLLPWFEHNVAFWGDFTSRRLDTREWVLSLLILALCSLALIRWRPAALVWITATAGYVVVMNASSRRLEPRHLIVLWLALVAAAWIAASQSFNARSARPQRASSLPTRSSQMLDHWMGADVLRLFGVLALAAGLAGLWWPAMTELREPFSGAQAAAEWIQENSDGELAVFCASEAPACSSVAIRLSTPAYTNSAGDPFTFVKWNGSWRTRVAPESVAADARLLEDRLQRRVVVVAHAYDYPPGCDRGWVSPVTIVTTERMAVCFLDQLPASDAPAL